MDPTRPQWTCVGRPWTLLDLNGPVLVLFGPYQTSIDPSWTSLDPIRPQWTRLGPPKMLCDGGCNESDLFLAFRRG